jgi:hypothetical protein
VRLLIGFDLGKSHYCILGAKGTLLHLKAAVEARRSRMAAQGCGHRLRRAVVGPSSAAFHLNAIRRGLCWIHGETAAPSGRKGIVVHIQ